MSSITFDTLKFADTLKASGIPDKLAEAQARKTGARPRFFADLPRLPMHAEGVAINTNTRLAPTCASKQWR